MNNVHFAIPEIYGETLSYYELLRKLVKAMNVIIENYDTIPDQIAEAVANLDASQLFSAVLTQLIDSIATDNTKSASAVKVYKKHDLLYATFNETVNLYESLIDFSTGTETELIVGSNIREVNISELFIELRTLIDINKNNIDAVTAVANKNSTEITKIHDDITAIENKNTEQDNEITSLKTKINAVDRTFTLANTDQNGNLTLLDNFRNYKFILALLIANNNEILASIYAPTELINDGYKLYPSYTSDTQSVVYITIFNGTTIKVSNNGNGHKIIIAGIDKIN